MFASKSAPLCLPSQALTFGKQLAELRAQQLEIRVHFVVDVLGRIVAELELLDVELFGDHVGVLLRATPDASCRPGSLRLSPAAGAP